MSPVWVSRSISADSFDVVHQDSCWSPQWASCPVPSSVAPPNSRLVDSTWVSIQCNDTFLLTTSSRLPSSAFAARWYSSSDRRRLRADRP